MYFDLFGKPIRQLLPKPWPLEPKGKELNCLQFPAEVTGVQELNKNFPLNIFTAVRLHFASDICKECVDMKG